MGKSLNLKFIYSASLASISKLWAYFYHCQVEYKGAVLRNIDLISTLILKKIIGVWWKGFFYSKLQDLKQSPKSKLDPYTRKKISNKWFLDKNSCWVNWKSP